MNLWSDSVLWLDTYNWWPELTVCSQQTHCLLDFLFIESDSRKESRGVSVKTRAGERKASSDRDSPLKRKQVSESVSGSREGKASEEKTDTSKRQKMAEPEPRQRGTKGAQPLQSRESGPGPASPETLQQSFPRKCPRQTQSQVHYPASFSVEIIRVITVSL